jgi:hypothetical protein
VEQDCDLNIKPLLKLILTWFMLFGLAQDAIKRINKLDPTHQVVFKRLGNFTTDFHFQPIRIPVDRHQNPSEGHENNRNMPQKRVSTVAILLQGPPEMQHC